MKANKPTKLSPKKGTTPEIRPVPKVIKPSVFENMVPPAEIPPLVLVEWEDATAISDGAQWLESGDREYSAQIFWQAGFLVKDVPEGIHLTEAWSPACMSNITQIPRGMIRVIKKLE